jgi:hypothetical protein
MAIGIINLIQPTVAKCKRVDVDKLSEEENSDGDDDDDEEMAQTGSNPINNNGP